MVNGAQYIMDRAMYTARAAGEQWHHLSTPARRVVSYYGMADVLCSLSSRAINQSCWRLRGDGIGV